MPPPPDDRDDGDPRPDDVPESNPWDELLDGLSRDEVEELARVQPLGAAYPLLHALVGRSRREFLLRAAALESLVGSELAWFSARDLEAALYWLDERGREAVLRALRQSGWLEHEPAAGTRVTEAGRWVHDVLSFLHRRVGEADLLPTVEGLRYAMEIGGLDPLHHLLSLRSRLAALREEIERARASHSEVVLRRTTEKVEEALSLSQRIRVLLDEVPVDNAPARRVCREVHDLLARLHGAGSELHEALTEVGRQYLRLTAGLTTEQIVEALMDLDPEDLAAAGREALQAVHTPFPLLTPEAVASAAEIHVLRDRPEAEEISWSEPEEAPRAAQAHDVPAHVARFVARLAEIAAKRAAEPLERLVPDGDPGVSFLRAGLLSLVGEGPAGEGIAGRLAALPLEVLVQGDGWPVELHDAPLRRLSPGSVEARARAEEAASGGED